MHKLVHHNHQTALNGVRQKIMIPGLRAKLKSVRTQCKGCKNNRSWLEAPEMSALPCFRTAALNRPFSHVGVDYFERKTSETCSNSVLYEVKFMINLHSLTLFTCDNYGIGALTPNLFFAGII